MARKNSPGCQCCIDECTLNPEDLPYKVTFEGIEIFSEDWNFNPSSDCVSYTILYAPGAWTEVKSATTKTIAHDYSYTDSRVACDRPIMTGCAGTPPTFSLVKTLTLKPYENYSASDALYLIYRPTSKTISLYKSQVKDCEDSPTSGCLWFATVQINYQYKSGNFRAYTTDVGCEVLAESFCCPATPTSSTYTYDDTAIFNYLKSGYPGGASTLTIVRSHRITEDVSETITFAENDCIPDCVVDGFAPRCHNWSVCDQEPIVFESTEIVTSQCFLDSLTINTTSTTTVIRYISEQLGPYLNTNCGAGYYAAVDCLAGMSVTIPAHTYTAVWKDELGNPCAYSPTLGGACAVDATPITVPLCDEPNDAFVNECVVRVLPQGTTSGNMYFAAEKACCGTSLADVLISYSNSGYTMQSITVTIPSINVSILW